MALVGSAATQPSSLGVEVPNRPRRAVGSAPRDWVAMCSALPCRPSRPLPKAIPNRRRAGACVDSRDERASRGHLPLDLSASPSVADAASCPPTGDVLGGCRRLRRRIGDARVLPRPAPTVRANRGGTRTTLELPRLDGHLSIWDNDGGVPWREERGGIRPSTGSN